MKPNEAKANQCRTWWVHPSGSSDSVITVATLTAEVWWWKYPLDDVFPIDPGWLNNFRLNEWDFGGDHAAFAYELARRADRSMNLRAWPCVTFDERNVVLDLFGKGKSRAEDIAKMKMHPKNDAQEFVEGFSSPSVWKLDAPDNSLLKTFHRFIKAERVKWNIKPRLTVGETNRNPHWDYCEVMDKFEMIPGYSAKGSDPQRILRRARSESKTSFNRLCDEVRRWRTEYPGESIWPEIPDILVGKPKRR